MEGGKLLAKELWGKEEEREGGGGRAGDRGNEVDGIFNFVDGE